MQIADSDCRFGLQRQDCRFGLQIRIADSKTVENAEGIGYNTISDTDIDEMISDSRICNNYHTGGCMNGKGESWDSGAWKIGESACA